jgi:hypothetical protein
LFGGLIGEGQNNDLLLLFFYSSPYVFIHVPIKAVKGEE